MKKIKAFGLEIHSHNHLVEHGPAEIYLMYKTWDCYLRWL